MFNPLSANLTKWPNTLKQFVGKLPANCLSVFGHFVNLALKGLRFSKIKLQRNKECKTFERKSPLPIIHNQISEIFFRNIQDIGRAFKILSLSLKVHFPAPKPVTPCESNGNRKFLECPFISKIMEL